MFAATSDGFVLGDGSAADPQTSAPRSESGLAGGGKGGVVVETVAEVHGAECSAV